MHISWILNALITTLRKRPKILLTPQVQKLLPMENRVIEILLADLDDARAAIVRSQLQEVNYVDRGMHFGRYEAFFSKISGLTVKMTRATLLPDFTEHMLVEKKLSLSNTEFHASLYATDGYVISLEADVDLQDLNRAHPQTKDLVEGR